MKKYGVMLLALLVCGATYATQDATLTQREVRDPRQLETILEANATDAETRLADIEAGTGIDDITVEAISCLGDLDITASNMVMKLRAAASTDLGRFAVRSLETVADRSDSDYVEWALLEAYDSATNWQTFAWFKIISSDITTATEDCNIQLWYDIAGTPTLGAVWDSDGLTIKQLKVEGTTTVQGSVDADSYTANAGAGIDVQSAGELKIGAATATSITIGDAGTTVEVVSSDWTISTAGVIANAALSADQLTAGSVASAIDGAAVTNIDAANIDAASTASAFDGSAITALAAANITAAGTLPQLNAAALTALDAANITAGTTASAFDGNAVTNLDLANLAAGTTAAAFDGAAITALNGANIASGDIAAARMTAYAALKTEVWGEAGITTSTVGAVAMADIQTKTIAAGNLEDYRVLRIWLSDTDMGVASTNNITTMVLSGGTAIETKTAEADYVYLTATDGTCSVAITGEAVLDKYIMVEDGSTVSSSILSFEP